MYMYMYLHAGIILVKMVMTAIVMHIISYADIAIARKFKMWYTVETIAHYITKSISQAFPISSILNMGNMPLSSYVLLMFNLHRNSSLANQDPTLSSFLRLCYDA